MWRKLKIGSSQVSDTHGHVAERVQMISRGTADYCDSGDSAIIILGDAGLNFWLNKTDKNNKKLVNSLGYSIYCVRGNHEERPENIPTCHLVYDPEVGNEVYVEDEYPLIHYFVDGNEYRIGEYSCLVLGGAYSIDKYYRLERARGGFSGWFEGEQLTPEERESIFNKIKGHEYDFVFSHTCPYSWRPIDLFMSGIDQNLVDESTEKWLEEIKNNIKYKRWLFGHFHANRKNVGLGVLMFYEDYEFLDGIMAWGGKLIHGDIS